MLRHGAGVTSVAFDRDGANLATGSDDATARVWGCEECGPIAQVVDVARDRVARPLTDDERRVYLP